jgi:hypothetical protein
MTNPTQEEMYYCDYLRYGFLETYSSFTLYESAAYAMGLIEDCAGVPKAIRQGSRIILETCDYDSLEELYRKALREKVS